MALDGDHIHCLAENCWGHGFVVRYPQAREDATGISADRANAFRYIERISVNATVDEAGFVSEA